MAAGVIFPSICSFRLDWKGLLQANWQLPLTVGSASHATPLTLRLSAAAPLMRPQAIALSAQVLIGDGGSDS